MKKNVDLKNWTMDVLCAVFAGIVVGSAYYFFQNSNGFAPGGVGGLATITHYLLSDAVSWSVLMVAFNLPIFVLLSAVVNRKLGLMLILYMLVQSFIPYAYEFFGAMPYCVENNGEDFNIVFACIATGVISGFGFSLMLRRFGASGGTYGISALIKKAKPAMNIAYVSFIMDASVVFIAFFVYGMKVTPVMCTLLNLFIANIIVDNGLSGIKNGYKFEIVTSRPTELSAELMSRLKHGVTEIKVHGMYSDTEKYMLVCIINKRQIGEMMKIIKSYPDTFASFEKVNEVFGNFKRKV
ncbi:MAG: YitT family protein [Clostridia bacterium]|nr:YitT family protein [Clostridia bacterium]MBQ4322605.1 YitT family protein [Clostridia bacterium]